MGRKLSKRQRVARFKKNQRRSYRLNQHMNATIMEDRKRWSPFDALKATPPTED